MSQSSNITAAYGNCPECGNLVRVPIDAKPRCQVNCPHCQAQFQLYQLLDLTVPELEIVSETTSRPMGKAEIPLVDRVLFSEEGEIRKKFKVPPQLKKGAKRNRRRTQEQSFLDQSNSSVGTLVSDEEAIELNGVESHSALSSALDNQDGLSSKLDTDIVEVKLGTSTHRSTHGNRKRSSSRRSRSRHRKHNSFDDFHDEPNPQLELIKMLFGGILALPLAYAILLWIFLQDPLGIAPSIGRVAPIAVPRVYRPIPENSPTIQRRSIFEVENDIYDDQPLF